jgi:hypothetical protein
MDGTKHKVAATSIRATILKRDTRIYIAMMVYSDTRFATPLIHVNSYAAYLFQAPG